MSSSIPKLCHTGSTCFGLKEMHRGMESRKSRCMKRMGDPLKNRKLFVDLVLVVGPRYTQESVVNEKLSERDWRSVMQGAAM